MRSTKRGGVAALAGAAMLATMVAGVLGVGAAPASADPTSDPTSDATAGETAGDPRVVLLLDASGSMNEPDPSGVSKLQAAQAALVNALGSFPAGAEVGLRVYGATVPGDTPTPEACADSQLVFPISPLDVGGLTTAITSFSAVGETPIAYAITQAAADLGDDGPRHIILVSDGEETCSPDPCAEVAALAGSGIELQIDTVGFGVDETAREQLACIADVAGGTYYDAANADALASTLATLSTRTARSFTVQGSPVVGTPTPDGAPELTAGQYTDTMPGATQGDVVRYYLIDREIAGSTLRVNTLARLPILTGDGGTSGTWRYVLTTPDGVECDTIHDVPVDFVGFGAVQSGTVLALGLDPRAISPTSSEQACAEADQLVLAVERSQSDTSSDREIEIRVIEEPPVTNDAELPEGAAEVPDYQTPVTSPAQGEPTTVIGGASFNDALEVAPGTYQVDLVPGELAFFAVPLDWGQSAVLAVDGPASDSAAWGVLGSGAFLAVRGDVFAPDLSPMDSQTTWRHASYSLENGAVTVQASADINQVPAVTYRGRWDSPAMDHSSLGFSMAGTYYLAVGLADDHPGIVGVSVPVRFSVAVTGAPAGVPEFASAAAPTESPSPSSSASDDDGPNLLVTAGAGLIVLGAVGAVGYTIWRRRFNRAA